MNKCAYISSHCGEVDYDYEFIEDYCDDDTPTDILTDSPTIGFPLTKLTLKTTQINDDDDDFARLVDLNDEESIGSTQESSAAIKWNPKTHPLTLMVSFVH